MVEIRILKTQSYLQERFARVYGGIALKAQNIFCSNNNCLS